MTTKYVFVPLLFILILLPSSLSRGTSPKKGIPVGSLWKVIEDGAKAASKIINKIGDIPIPVPKNASLGSIITYNYNVRYSYIDIAFKGPYADAEFDFTGDTIWANCDRKEANPIYVRSKSSNFSFIPCTDSVCPQDWNSTCPKQCSESLVSSDDQDSSQVSFARDTNFTLGSLVLAGSDIAFLCGTQNNGTYVNISGIIGLGWGDLSLVSQLGYGKFSYCLSSNFSDISPLFLLDSQPILSGDQVQSISLIQSSQSSSYYVNLTDISVGTKLLPILNSPFSLREDGTGGVLLDSFSIWSFLPMSVYIQVTTALISIVSLPEVDSNIGLDLCFSISDTNQLYSMPIITLHFDGGADMVVDPYYYLVPNGDNASYCLAILPSSSNQSFFDESVSVLGYMLQSDTHMFFDLKKSKLSYTPANCSTSMIQQHSVTSNLIPSTAVGIYLQILFTFMFQVLVGFVVCF